MRHVIPQGTDKPYQNVRPSLSPGIAFNNNINALDGARTNYLVSDLACGENSRLDSELPCWYATKEVVQLCGKALQSRGKSARSTDLSTDDPKDSVSNFLPITLVMMQHCDKTGTRATSGGSGMRRDSAGCEKGLLPELPERGCCDYIRITKMIHESIHLRPWNHDPSALDITTGS